jgi:competence ComEA-like helix-hairpin-helix protein
VELNTATQEELCTLPGIGPRKAQAILALRKKRPFTRVTQLLEVRGIGRKTLERLKPYIRLEGPGGGEGKPAKRPTPQGAGGGEGPG